MPLCGSQNCGCAITSESLSVSGNGTPESPWVLETIDPIDLTEVEDDIEALEAFAAAAPATYVNVTGDTMTGQLDGITPVAAANLTRKDYVDALVATQMSQAEADALYVSYSGDTMYGPLVIYSASNQALILRTSATGASANTPYVRFTTAAGTSLGYLQATTTDMRLWCDGANVIFYADGAERMRIAGNTVLIGKTATNVALAGVEIAGQASTIEGRLSTTTGSLAAFSNIVARHVGPADASGELYAIFQLTAGTTAGYIQQGSGNNTIFNAGSGGSHIATSDYRYKTDLGPIDDPVGKVMALQPKHLEWLPISGSTGEFDGLIAHEVAAIVPNAVIGEYDAVYGEGHPMEGDVDPQGLDESKIVPLLIAALQNALERIDALENP